MSSSKNIVPFGKHKGQPVEVLLADRKYSEWLSAQEWFRERFVDLFRLINAGGSVSQDTPEHNAMQVKFLSHEHFAPWVIKEYGPKHLAWCVDGIARREAELNREALNKIERNWDRHLRKFEGGEWVLLPSPIITVSSHADPDVISRYDGKKPARVEDLRQEDRVRLERPSSISELRLKYHSSFEDRGADVGITVEFEWGEYYGTQRFRVELKPEMGDDFPAVLRQTQASQCNLVIVGQYGGSGASWEQVQAVFKTSGITLILESDLAAQ